MPYHDRIYSITLPWPPSTNELYLYDQRTNRRYLNPKVKAYRRAVRKLVLVNMKPFLPFNEIVAIRIGAQVPDRRRRDMDNVQKCLFDAFTHGGVWKDDSLVDEIHVFRRVKKGEAKRIDVTIWVIHWEDVA